MKKNHTNQYRSGKIRIISGVWGGRKIVFPKDLHVRPTSDQTRETLFNWLNPYIKKAICLDLFAGSGALGFEALSRGAQKVIALDKEKSVIQHLTETAKKFNTDSMQIIQLCMPNDSLQHIQKFDIIFIDPPFRENLIQPTINWIIKNALLNKGSLIYLEQEKDLSVIHPKNWIELHTKYTLETKYQLMQVG